MMEKTKKVVVVFPMDDKQTGPAFVHAFNSLGCYTVGICTKTGYKPTKILEHVKDADLVFCGREPELVEVIDDIRKATSARVVCFNPDARDSVKEFKDLLYLFRRCSALYTVAAGNVEEYRSNGINAFWCPQGLQDEVYKTFLGDIRDEFKCDVSFIGRDRRRGLHEGRSEVLDAIELINDVSHKWWGCREGRELWDEELCEAAIGTKINIAHSGWSHLSRYWSVRGFKLMGAGGFVLANYHSDMADWIPCIGNDKVLDYYRDVNELEDKIRYYLKNDEKRKQIAERGRKWALENTYRRRAADILKHVEQPDTVFFSHHYTDIVECDSPIPDPLEVKKITENVVATITTPETVEGTKALIKSIRLTGWTGNIHVFTPNAEGWLTVADALDQPNVSICLMEEWYDAYKKKRIRNADARYLKPKMIECYEDNDKVIFLDGADTLVFGDLNVIFQKLDTTEFIATIAEQNKKTTLPNDYYTLFNGRVARFNSGVWAFRKGPISNTIFTLWKAFCPWSLSIEHGDQTAYCMALSNCFNDNETEVLDETYNYLPMYKFNLIDEKPVTPDGRIIHILHAAGGARDSEGYKQAYTIVEHGVP